MDGGRNASTVRLVRKVAHVRIRVCPIAHYARKRKAKKTVVSSPQQPRAIIVGVHNLSPTVSSWAGANQAVGAPIAARQSPKAASIEAAKVLGLAEITLLRNEQKEKLKATRAGRRVLLPWERAYPLA
jgi:hypothetical protein